MNYLIFFLFFLELIQLHATNDFTETQSMRRIIAGSHPFAANFVAALLDPLDYFCAGAIITDRFVCISYSSLEQ